MNNAMIHSEEHADAVHIICNGDFTLTNAAQILSALTVSTTRKGSEVLLLAHVSVIDVAGIQMAYGWKTTLDSQGRSAKVILPESDSLKDLLVKTGITKIF